MGLMWLVACGLLFTLSFLCNEAYINKIGLSPSIFVLGPLEVSCMVRSWDLVYGLQFANLILSSGLCARMLGQLGAKIREAMKLEVRMLG